MSTNSNICRSDLRSVIQSVVSRFLYREDINNMCGANRYLNELFIEDWRYVYRICLHHQPHNYDGPAVINTDGFQEWYKEGKRHREGDQPAIIWPCGTREWYKEGKWHREGDQPAIIKAGGYGFQAWYKEGKRHREGDQPAKICASGTQFWLKKGTFHRDGDQPAIIWANGDQEWWEEGGRIK